MEWIQVIEIVAATIGILYVWLELKASMWLWPVGIILPLFYIYISLESQVYGNIIVNIYYMIACIYGWIKWRKYKGNVEEDVITRVIGKSLIGSLLMVLILIVLLTPFFDRVMHSPFAIFDAIATSVSLVGMWLLAHKYIENWYCWILSNFIYCLLYFYQGFYITGLFFSVYTVLAVLGYMNWKKLMGAQSRV